MKTNNQLLISIVDDDKVFVEILSEYIFQHFPTIKSIKKYYNGKDALENICYRPNIVFLDYNLCESPQHARNGLSILKSYKHRAPKTSVYIVSSIDNLNFSKKMIKSGADGYIKKDNDTFKNINKIITQAIVKKAENDIKINRDWNRWLFLLLAMIILIALFFYTII